MEYLQYKVYSNRLSFSVKCFKPYYKWNTFNTPLMADWDLGPKKGFKPYYKWNTFNTLDLYKDIDFIVN